MKPEGLESRVLSLTQSGVLEACVTEEILAEYQDVLFRDKFRQWRAASDILLSSIFERASRVTPTTGITAAIDEDDNRFLECADAANAAFLITGNLRHYPAHWNQTKILNARMFFDLIGTKEQTDSRPDL